MIIEDGRKNIFIYGIGAWAIYAISHVVLKNIAPGWDGVLSLVSINILNLTGFIYSFWLWKNTRGRSRRIFGFFVASFVFVMIASSVYFSVYNILLTSQDQVSALILSVDSIPYIFHVICRILAFASILPKLEFCHARKINLKVGMPVVLLVTITAFLSFLLFGLNQRPFSSLIDFYSSIEMTLEPVAFALLVLCVVVAKNRGIFYMGLGYLVCLVPAFIMSTNLLSQSYNTASFFETFWFLGILSIVYGLVYFRYSGTYKDDSLSWVESGNSIKTQTTFWALIFCVFATVVSFLILVAHYLLSPHDGWALLNSIKQTIATIFLVFTFIFTIGSMIFIKIIFRPLRRLNIISKNFIDNLPLYSSESEKFGGGTIHELDDIEAMLRKSYEVTQERDSAVRAIAKITSIAAHDVCSPLMALKISLDQMKDGLPARFKDDYSRALLSYDSIMKIIQEFRIANQRLKPYKKNINTTEVSQS